MTISTAEINQLKAYFLSKDGGAVTGHILPSTTEDYNLGSPTQRWDTIYAREIVVDVGGGGGETLDAETVQGFGASALPVAETLLALDVNAQYPSSVYAEALLIDGTRQLNGSMAVIAGATIDGIDLSTHVHTGVAGSGGKVTHGDLLSLDADDHPHYAQRAQDEIITGDWMFTHLVDRSAGWMFLPDEKKFTAVPHNLSMYADADKASLELGEVIATEPAILLYDDNTPTSYLKVGRGDISVTLSATDPNYRMWAGNETAATAPFRISTDGTTTIHGANIYGNLESNNYVAEQKGWHLDESGFAEFGNVNVRGRITSVVYQKLLASAVSGRQIFTDGAVVAVEIDATTTTVYFKEDSFLRNDFVQFIQGDRSEWIQILSDPVIVGDNFEYIVSRDLEGIGGAIHYVGETAVRKGTATSVEAVSLFSDPDNGFGALGFGGGSYSALGGFMTIEGDRNYGPYFAVTRRFGADYNQLEDVVRIGRLANFLGIATDEYGIGVGDVNRYFMYDAINGLQIKTAGGSTSLDDNGISSDQFALGIVVSPPAYVDGYANLYFDDTSQAVHVRVKDGAYESDMALTPSSAATGAEVTAGTNNTKFATPLALADAGVNVPTPAASTTVAGKVEIAIASEIDTGTDTGRAISPDSLAGSNLGIRYAQIAVFLATSDIETGDGKAYFVVPPALAGMNLVSVHAKVITAGTTNTTDIQIANVTDAVDMLSTKITIDSAETGSDTAVTPAVINGTYDDVAAYDLLRIDVDAKSTTAPKGLIVTFGFQLP